MQNQNKQPYIDFILDCFGEGLVERGEVMAKFGEVWQTPSRTFDRYFKKAKEQHSQQRETINNAKLEQSIETEKEAVKIGLKSKFERLLILQKEVDNCTLDLDNGYTDRLKARCLLESESRNPGSTFSSLRRYMIQGFINLIFKDKETFEKYSKMTEDEMKANFIDGDIRKLNQNEMERLQTVPNGYTSTLKRNEAACLLGDGWTVDTIAHIFSFIEVECSNYAQS